MEIWVIVTGTLVLVLMLWGLMRTNQREMQSPDEVLEEVEIYQAYGRYREARTVLETAITRFPDNPALKMKLDEISER